MGPLAGMGIGILKSELVDRPREMRQRELEASQAALSPWATMGTQAGPYKVKPIKEANWQMSALQGAAAGAQGGGGWASLAGSDSGDKPAKKPASTTSGGY